MKIYAWLLILFVACTSHPTAVVWNEKDFAWQHDTLYYRKQLFSGVVCRYNAQQQRLEQGSFENGLRQGFLERWYANGQLAEKRFYLSNEKEGQHQAWWENGQQKFDYTFDNGTPVGTHKEWYASGQLLSLSTYNAQGQPEGLQQMWFENGKIRANYEIRAGRRFGLLGAKGCMGGNETQITDIR